MNRLARFAVPLALAAVAGLVTLSASAAEAFSFAGTWTTSFDSSVGQQTYTYTIKNEGGKLTGHAKSNLGEGPLSDIKVEKDKITFIEQLNYQGMDLAISYDGTVVSADEIKFKRDVGGQGGEEFTLKREKK
jgi:hypothetical protein